MKNPPVQVSCSPASRPRERIITNRGMGTARLTWVSREMNRWTDWGKDGTYQGRITRSSTYSLSPGSKNYHRRTLRLVILDIVSSRICRERKTQDIYHNSHFPPFTKKYFLTPPLFPLVKVARSFWIHR